MTRGRPGLSDSNRGSKLMIQSSTAPSRASGRRAMRRPRCSPINAPPPTYQLLNLSTLSGDASSTASAINDCGQVAGYSTRDGVAYAFETVRDGQVIGVSNPSSSVRRTATGAIGSGRDAAAQPMFVQVTSNKGR